MYTAGDIRDGLRKVLESRRIWLDVDGLVAAVIAELEGPPTVDIAGPDRRRGMARAVDVAVLDGDLTLEDREAFHDCAGRMCPICAAWRLRNHGGGSD